MSTTLQASPLLQERPAAGNPEVYAARHTVATYVADGAGAAEVERLLMGSGSRR